VFCVCTGLPPYIHTQSLDIYSSPVYIHSPYIHSHCTCTVTAYTAYNSSPIYSPLHLEFHWISISNLILPGLFSSEHGKYIHTQSLQIHFSPVCTHSHCAYTVTAYTPKNPLHESQHTHHTTPVLYTYTLTVVKRSTVPCIHTQLQCPVYTHSHSALYTHTVTVPCIHTQSQCPVYTHSHSALYTHTVTYSFVHLCSHVQTSIETQSRGCSQ